MALPAAIAIGARVLTPILARAGASAATRAGVATVGRVAGKVALAQTLGGIAGGAMNVAGGLSGMEPQTHQTTTSGMPQDTGSLLDMDDMPPMGRSACFGEGCGF